MRTDLRWLRALVADLTVLGIEIRVVDGKLCCRPQSRMTPELLARIRLRESTLVAMLTDTKTPTGATVGRGFGSGDTDDSDDALGGAVDEAVPLAALPTEMWDMLERVRRHFPGAEVVRVEKVKAAPRQPLAEWPSLGQAAVLPAGVAELAAARTGWTPHAWRARLIQLADRCETMHPERATELRHAALVLSPGLLEECEKLAAILELDDALPRTQAVRYAALETLKLIQRDHRDTCQ